MAHSAPLIQRLQLHQGKTRRMLTPGKKDSPGQHNPVASGLNAWGTQKYSQIAQNMRFLRRERLGNFSPEKINLIGREIPAKFSNPASLLHIKPSPTEKDSIWSEVEQVLPAGEPAAPEARTQNEADVMRQGTVIQRLPTVPKPGQSIESFKEQIQSRKTTAKPVAPARIPPKPSDPAVRRYARIEEIPQKTTATPAEDSTGPDSAPTAESAPGDTIHRQVEAETDRPLAPENSDIQPKTTSQQAAPLPRPPAQTAKPSAPISQESRPSQPPSEAAPTSSKKPETASPSEAKPVPTQKPLSTPNAATEPPTSAPQESEPVERETLPRLTFSQSNAVAPDAPPAEKLTLADKPLPRARPTPRQGRPATQTPDRSLPQAKATPSPRPQPASLRTESRKPAAAQTSISGLSASILQRQPDTTKTVATPPTPPVYRPESSPSADSRPTPPLESPEQTRPTTIAPLEMPAIEYRRTAPGQVRFLDAKSIKPILQPEMLKPSLPLIQRALASTRSETKPASPQAGENLPVSRTKPSFSYTQPESAPQPTLATIPMPVAHLPHPTPAMISQPAPPQQPLATETTTPQPTSLPEISPAPIKATAQNVVQRLWDEHSPPASASGQASNAGSSESSQAGSALDLDKIAEEVLPIVKRLIEIESERSAGYLR